jgi:hypothetical protein
MCKILKFINLCNYFDLHSDIFRLDDHLEFSLKNILDHLF